MFTKWVGEFECDGCGEIFSDDQPIQVALSQALIDFIWDNAGAALARELRAA